MAETWREIARRVIQRVIEKNKHLSEKELQKAISQAYPFGERSCYPYAVWLDEIKKQLGCKKEQDNFLIFWGVAPVEIAEKCKPLVETGLKPVFTKTCLYAAMEGEYEHNPAD